MQLLQLLNLRSAKFAKVHDGQPKDLCGRQAARIARRLALTQKLFAQRLGVSLPYLNQMENNNRPVSTAVVLALAQEFGFDVTELQSGDEARLVGDMREALADPVFAGDSPPLADLRLAASNAPSLARAFLDLHRAYRQTHERLASLDEALGREDARLRPAHGKRCATSFTIATTTSTRWTAPPNGLRPRLPPVTARPPRMATLGAYGITVSFAPDGPLRRYDPAKTP